MSDTIETREIVKNGITYKVTIEADYDVRPESDGDWASQEDIDAWKRDEWRYVGVIVTPVIAGTEIEGADDSLWGCAWGTVPGNPVEFDMDEICNVHPVPQIIETVNGKLKVFAAKIQAAVAGLE